MFARKLLWLLLCLVAGGSCAFLALEGIGLPLVALVMAGIPEAISWFQQGDALNGIYFVAHLLVAVAIVLIGCRQLLARRQPRQAV